MVIHHHWASRYQNSTDHNQINLETIEGQSEQPEVPVKDEPEVALDVEEVGQLDGGPGTYPETDEFEPQSEVEVEAEVQSDSDTITQNN